MAINQWALRFGLVLNLDNTGDILNRQASRKRFLFHR